jgi:hypothetical protein
MLESGIKKVTVVFKTHLDIGFTDFAAKVMAQYRESFIPAAVDLAFKANRPGANRFVWTTGSYLIRDYLRTAPPQNAARLEEAIGKGFIRWHGLPFTTHTELMDRPLLEYGLSISRELDRRFGVATIAAKMTDVPGHTVAMVPPLAESGVEFLHLGVNASSRVPNVPPLFRWRFRGREVTVAYAGDYGEPVLLENGAALELVHTHDNMGPPPEAELDRLYEGLSLKYPNAAISAGTLDDFALALREVRAGLPVVAEEIGDTWIHGVAADPLKTSRFMRLLRLKDEWLENGELKPESEEYGRFMEQLLLVAEHTCGMDCKKHLLDFTNWEKRAFTRARAEGTTSYALFSPLNRHLFEAHRPELDSFRGERETSSYALFERSHAEQRAYIEKAVASLPPRLAGQAGERLAFGAPARELPGRGHAPCETFAVGGWQVEVGKDGQLTRLSHPSWQAPRPVSLGLFEYQVFDGKTVSDCYFGYGRGLRENYYWSEFDFGKPGLRYEASLKDACYRAVPEAIESTGDSVHIWLRAGQEACERFGCPRELELVHRFGETKIITELYWRGKDALRSPEAIWLHFELGMKNPNRWRYRSLGQDISPLDVVSGGNRKSHCVQSLAYRAADGEASITPLDSPLAYFGAKSLYSPDDAFENPGGGFYFLLCNNRWGTNFKQWFDEDARFSFETTIKETKTAP